MQKTARARIRAAEHLLHWTEREGIPISDVTENLLKRFRQHLERCRCPGFGPVRLDLFRGDRLFLDYLRNTGLLTTSSEPHQDPPLLVAFRQWMRQERGTGDGTLYQYSLRIQALLERLGDDPRRFDAQNLRQFVLETHRHAGWGVAKKCTTALRMFLRFLIAEGRCAAGLDAAIPVLAHWRFLLFRDTSSPKTWNGSLLPAIRPRPPAGEIARYSSCLPVWGFGREIS